MHAEPRERPAPLRQRLRPAGPAPPRAADGRSGPGPAGYLGAGADGREFWLVAGHVYSSPPTTDRHPEQLQLGARASHVCRLAAYNRLRRA